MAPTIAATAGPPVIWGAPLRLDVDVGRLEVVLLLRAEEIREVPTADDAGRDVLRAPGAVALEAPPAGAALGATGAVPVAALTSELAVPAAVELVRNV